MTHHAEAAHKMTNVQREMLSLCRRAYTSGACGPEYVAEQGKMFYPCVQKQHDRVLLLSSDARPEIVAVAMFKPDGTPVHFEDWHSGDTFAELA
jgi:hypothetical protein